MVLYDFWIASFLAMTVKTHRHCESPLRHKCRRKKNNDVYLQKSRRVAEMIFDAYHSWLTAGLNN